MVSVCGGNCLFGDGVKNCNENFCRFLCSKYECSKQVFYSQSQPWIKFYSVFAYIYKTKKKKRNRYLQNPTCQCSFSPSLLGRMMMISREDVKRAWQCSIGYTIFLYMSVFRYQDYCSFGLLTIWTSSHLVLWTSGLWTSGHPDIWPLDFWSLDQCMTNTVSAQVGKSACIVLTKERHSKGERVPFSAWNQSETKMKPEAATHSPSCF